MCTQCTNRPGQGDIRQNVETDNWFFVSDKYRMREMS